MNFIEHGIFHTVAVDLRELPSTSRRAPTPTPTPTGDPFPGQSPWPSSQTGACNFHDTGYLVGQPRSKHWTCQAAFVFVKLLGGAFQKTRGHFLKGVFFWGGLENSGECLERYSSTVGGRNPALTQPMLRFPAKYQQTTISPGFKLVRRDFMHPPYLPFWTGTFQKPISQTLNLTRAARNPWSQRCHR